MQRKQGNLSKDISLRTGPSVFEEKSFVPRSETFNLYHLLEVEPMHVYVFDHSRKLNNVYFVELEAHV